MWASVVAAWHVTYEAKDLPGRLGDTHVISFDLIH